MKAMKTFCIQYYQGADALPEQVWVHCCEEDHPGRPCTGRGHDFRGCFVHMRTTSAVSALRKGLKWGYKRAKEHVRWQEEEKARWAREKESHAS